MNFIFETAVNIVEAFLILDFLTRYFSFKSNSIISYLGFIFFLIVSTISITFFSWNKSFEIISGIIQIIINFVFCLSFLKGNISTKLFWSTFIMGGIVLVSSSITIIVGHIGKYDVEDLFTRYNYIRITAILLSKVIFFQITRIILKMDKNYKLTKNDIFPLIIIPFISIFVILFLVDIAIEFPQTQKNIFYAICLIIILQLLTYYLFIRISKNNKLKLDYELLELQYKSYKKNALDIQNMYESIRSIRHDIKNHLLCILNILEKNNKKLVYDYIQNLIGQQEFTNHSIIFSGNDVLDAIINTKQSKAKHYGLSIDITIANTLTFMSADDICILIGNLLDNAILAAKESKEKQITLNIQPQDTYVSIFVSNSIDKSILKDNPELKTTKTNKDYHGYGIKNIKKVAETYNGLVRFYEDNNLFISDILLLAIPMCDL